MASIKFLLIGLGLFVGYLIAYWLFGNIFSLNVTIIEASASAAIFSAVAMLVYKLANKIKRGRR